mmetsp:Transcript_54480/g.122558  ORF Transcript_54480/g.122558 Transcript_54480/m.122558 type:complete len:235 (-) Transcript_54480:94-798(-)
MALRTLQPVSMGSRRQRGTRQRTLAAVALAALVGLCASRCFVAPGPSAAGAEASGMARRTVLGGLLVAAPMPVHAEGLLSGSAMKPYSVVNAFSVSFPSDFEVLKEDPAGYVLQGDKVQPAEQMTAAGKVVSYANLATGFGANITEVGQRLAAKRPTGAAKLVGAKADPTGAGIDAYQFEFQGDQLHELWLIAVVKRGNENVLCNVAVRTPNLVWDTRKELFEKIIASFKPLSA